MGRELKDKADVYTKFGSIQEIVHWDTQSACVHTCKKKKKKKKEKKKGL